MVEIPIVFENDGMLVINKPAGVVVMAGPGHEHGQTIAGWIEEYTKGAIVGVGYEGRWGIVHRLDKDTSGVMFLAKKKEVFDAAVQEFRERKVEKEYVAYVWGDVAETVKRLYKKKFDVSSDTRFFTLDLPIARHPKGISKFIISQNGKSSVSSFRIDEVFKKEDEKYSLVAVFPKTGRTHQIRVHVKAIGHPIVGDVKYQTKNQSGKSQLKAYRLFLHAKSLRIHILDEDFVFDASVPEEFSSFRK